MKSHPIKGKPTRKIPAHHNAPAESIYTDDDIGRLASAVDVDISSIAAIRHMLDSAAMWYRLFRPGQTIARSGSGGMSPSQLERKLKTIQNSADRIIRNIGIDPDEIDGSQIFDALAHVTTDEMVVEWVRALGNLKMAAPLAAEAAQRTERLMVPEGNAGDVAINRWLGDIMAAYQKATGRRPALSVGKPESPEAGQAMGPLLRFVEAASTRIEVSLDAEAWASRIRRILQEKH